MATGPRGRRTGGSRGRTTAAKAAPADPKDAIVDAFMALLAEKPLARVGLDDIAERAGIPLADLRDAFPGRIAILRAFARRIDRQVLEAGPATGEDARDRLFEVMMRRFDALAPHKDAIRRVADAARRDPCLAALLHGLALGSQRWTLAAAGIRHSGCFGAIAVEGAVLVHAETLRVWLDDDDLDQAKTMAALDRALRRGERVMSMVSRVCGFLPGMAGRARRDRGAESEAAA